MKPAALGILALSLLAASAPAPQDTTLPSHVEEAIDRGLAFLKDKRTGPCPPDLENGDELIMMARLHAGTQPPLADISKLLESRLERTYKVALTAMCLEKYDRVSYQWRLYQCAQFLADNISPDGQIRYGLPSPAADEIGRTAAGERDPAKRVRLISEINDVKPKVKRLVAVKQQRPGPAGHDHSNMQIAAQGLLACHDAGLRFEPELLRRIEEHWRKSLISDPGAPEDVLKLTPPIMNLKPGLDPARFPVTVKVAPAGWGYQEGSDKPCGSMTAGAVGSLCILLYMQGKDWREDKDVLQGLQWINKHYSVTENPGLGEKWYYYYLYNLERAGTLFGTEIIGEHRWYHEGAERLIKDQKDDGSWGGGVLDTCFALLFLKRTLLRDFFHPNRK